MPITRKLNNGYEVTDWTQDVIDEPIQEGMLNELGLFNEQATSQNAIIFEKNTRDFTLLAQTSRSGRDATVGKDRSSKIHSLALPYFKHVDSLWPADIQGQREYGDPDGARTLARAIATKVEDMQIRGKQTKEYMKWEAIKGNTVDPDGNTIANMFTEFNVTQLEVDFLLGTSTTDVLGKVSEVKRLLAANNRSGRALSNNIIIPVGNEFFDKLRSHPKMTISYANYKQEDGVQRLRDNLFDFRDYGAVATFSHDGVTFVNHEPSFTAPDGVTTLNPIATTDGYTVLPSARDLYRGYNGPANKLSGANNPGAPMFLYQYPDQKDEGIEFELEMSPLYFMTEPLLSVKVTTSN